ncbi:MAG: DUF2278 family protein, partial [Burkholderiaceae bacterium]
MNNYCLFKGKLEVAAPYKEEYNSKPHYVIYLSTNAGGTFKIVVNSASTVAASNGNNQVFFYCDLNFDDPINQELDRLDPGLHTRQFPRLDYFQDASLLNLGRMRPIPYEDENGDRVDVNDIISDILTIDTGAAPQSLPFDNGHAVQDRDFFSPTDADVTVYGFGFLFEPKKDGLHETHMNQGNPRGPHWKENGTFQDGAVIVQRNGKFMAIFTAFQTQY